MRVVADHDIVEHAQLAIETQKLEGSGQPEPGNHVCRTVRDIDPVEADMTSLVRLIHPGKKIEEGRFAGSVWPDQPVDRVRLHFQADLVDRLQTAKALAQVTSF